MAKKIKRKKGKVGRHSKYTYETVKDILKVISIGGSDKSAYEYAGISIDCFYSWLRKKKVFSDKVTQARVKGKLKLHQKINNASDEDWRAAGWLLSRRWPEDYSERFEHTGKDGQPLQVGIIHYGKKK